MSHPHETDHEIGSDTSAVEPMPITSKLAEEAEEVLRDFAEEAELNTALIVNRDSTLIAGISSEEEIAVEEISALVAAASSAVKSLIQELGEIGAIESIHQGEDRVLYLHDLLGRFILVGVSDTGLPAGIIRRQAVPVRAKLSELLKDVAAAADDAESPTGRVQRSLRITGMLRGSHEKEETEAVVDELLENEETEEEVQPTEDIIEDEPPVSNEAPDEESKESPQAHEEQVTAVEEILEEPESVTIIPKETEVEQEPEVEDLDVAYVEEEAPEEGEVEPPPLEEELEVEEEIVAEETDEEEETKPSRPATIVVDSPFEAVSDDDNVIEDEPLENEEQGDPIVEEEESPAIISDWGGGEDEIEIIDETVEIDSPEEQHQAEEIPEPPIPEPEKTISEAVEPIVDEPEEILEEEITGEQAPKKTGPRYSFELG